MAGPGCGGKRRPRGRCLWVSSRLASPVGQPCWPGQGAAPSSMAGLVLPWGGRLQWRCHQGAARTVQLQVANPSMRES
eukprot:7346211-Heterocapsa_arctica.AAC.1